MFTKDGIRELHRWTHQSLDILLECVARVPADLLRTTLAGFGVPTVWKQLVHILEVERAGFAISRTNRLCGGVKKSAGRWRLKSGYGTGREHIWSAWGKR